MEETERYYDINGNKYPSVTTVLKAMSKPALVSWLLREDRRIMTLSIKEVLKSGDFSEERLEEVYKLFKSQESKAIRASTFGNNVHSAVERELLRRLGDTKEHPELTPKAQAVYEKWLAWYDKCGFKPLSAEKLTYSYKYGYAGTLDHLASGPSGKVYLLDWKTTKAIYAESFLQNVAYRNSEQELGQHTDGGIIVRLPKSGRGTIETRVVPDNTTLEDFLAVLRVWNWMKANEFKWVKKGS